MQNKNRGKKPLSYSGRFSHLATTPPGPLPPLLYTISPDVKPTLDNANVTSG